MKTPLLLLVGMASLVAGCGTYTTAIRNVDWKALEEQTRTTGPLQLTPEYEPANLRIPLLFVDVSPQGERWLAHGRRAWRRWESTWGTVLPSTPRAPSSSMC